MVGNNTEASQNPKSKTTICPSNPSPGVYRKQPTKLKTCVHANVHSSVIYNNQDMEATWVHKQMSRLKRCDLYTHTLTHCRKQCCAELLSHVPLCDPWTVVCQAPLSMGVLQATVLAWVARPSSRGSSQPRGRTQVSPIAGRFFTI